ncbi:hypothetical protein BKA66DRAFT_407517 [Pyrenochaeta sp. MPI-SDFR-AT-0127]|nr:hypothetical protein BKA66DRAFT_407517 [Pyrenochaeta sp. MPI-SDFR-AT-0127]
MRLLRWNDNGEVELAEFSASNEATPPYAILSHTWGADGDEVTFEDLKHGTGKDKPGFKKIWFCGEQARKDSLQYFWIDTCCINKTNYAELSHVIKSMFRWYRNASRCYVYLPDVHSHPFDTSNELHSRPWEPDFRNSRWFTRGWTLQELLAPHSVEFFSQERKRLGDKRSLTQQIHEITGIPASALQGASLSQFAVKERLSWIGQRQTKLEEDKAYSLQGIFDVYIAPIYKEGTARAFQRLMDEIDKLEKCIQDLRLTDPRDDKRRIEDTKGGLMEDSYRWILENPDFQQWHDSEHRRLLWIKGDPGKGKTMLLCGIINELKKSIPKTDLLSYFYCQATDSRINSATTVLRGLLYLIISQQPSLASHVRKKYDYAGKTIFEDANAWVALTEIFADVLLDPSLNTIYLIIDALDECVTDLPKLLNFIIRHSSASSRIKWIISSRNSLDIEERLERAGSKVRLSLELNAECVSMAVNIFIEQKVSQLAQQKKYDERTRNAVLEHLALNANNTFLWVALVCQNLEATLKRNVLKKLNLFPPGLDSLYGRMMKQISQSDDAELCKQILASVTLVYQPITLDELAALVEQLEDKASDPESIRDIISLCGSFITLQEETIYFVHQSAKDFLLARAAKVAFPSGRENVHYTIFVRSLKILSRTLRRDMYGLKALGYPIKDVKQPDLDPLAGSRYSCIYWLVDDARRFIMYHKGAIESSPLQAYASALLFSPTGSLIRRLFQHEEPKWISIKPAMGDSWGACLLTLEGHSHLIQSSVAFSHESTQLASASRDRTVKIWDTSSGARLHNLRGHSDWVCSVAFSHDSTQLASASRDRTVKIWDTSSGACLQTLEGHSHSIRSVTFSHDSTRLASASEDRTYLDAGVSSDNTWITHGGKNILWVPSEYRASCSTVSGKDVGIGVGSGRVWICSFDLNKSEDVSSVH